jgi:uroporphyrinogen decarboxylase
MNKRDRVIATLHHHEPDAVPIGELAIDPCIIDALVGTKNINETTPQMQAATDRRRKETSVIDSTVRAHKKIGFDMIACDTSTPDEWNAQHNADGTMNDEWGRVLSYDPNSRVWTQTGSIFNSREEYENFTFPDPNASGRTFAIEETKKRISGDEIAIVGSIRDPFAYAWEMFRVTDFVRWLYEKPDFLRRVIERIADFNIVMIKRIAEAGVDLVVGDGDYCEKRGPLVPIKFFKDAIFPNLEKQVQAAHRVGLKFIKHTDGNINPILPDLAKIVDGLHSLDPSAGVDIEKVKQLYGSELVLMGNVSVDNLCTRTTGEIAEETKRCLRTAAPGGGYILCSSNSWYSSVKLENCLAMVAVGRTYGHYPIRIK